MTDLVKDYKKAKTLRINTVFEFFAIFLFVFLAFVLVYRFQYTCYRLLESVKDMGIEFARFGADFLTMLLNNGYVYEVDPSSLTVKSQYVEDIVVPSFPKDSLVSFWQLFIDYSIFRSFLESLLPNVKNFVYILMLGLPLLLSVAILIKRKFDAVNTEVKRSKSLKFVDFVYQCVILKSIDVIRAFCVFLKDHKYFCYVYMFLIAMSFNYFTFITYFFN